MPPTVDSPEYLSGLGYLAYWVWSSPFLDEATGVQLGGPGGIRFGLFLILHVLVVARRMELSTVHAGYPELLLQFATQSTSLLIAQIESSIRLLSNPDRRWVRKNCFNFTVYAMDRCGSSGDTSNEPFSVPGNNIPPAQQADTEFLTKYAPQAEALYQSTTQVECLFLLFRNLLSRLIILYIFAAYGGIN